MKRSEAYGRSARRRILGACWAAALGLLVPLAASAAVDMKEGEWENTIEMKMEIPGMPFAMPPMTFNNKSCLTQKDAAPNTAQKDQQCEVKDYKVSGNKISWKSRCVDKDGAYEGAGEVTYRGATYDGSMQMKSIPKDPKAASANIAYKLSGRYVGACKEK